MIPKRLAVSYSLIILSNIVHADLFTSTADLQRLLDEEKDIPNLIESFIFLTNIRLEQLKNFVQQYKNSLGSQKNADISNPINAYRMIRRLVNTRREFESLLENDPMQNIHDIIRHFYPADYDVNGAINGLLRLQDTYQLATNDLAEGKFFGRTIGNQMTAYDCFEIALNAYKQEDYYHSIMWLEESRHRLDKSNKKVSEAKILEYLASALYQQGNLKRALQITDRLSMIVPDHPQAKSNIQQYEEQLEAKGVPQSEMRKNIPPLINERSLEEASEHQDYEYQDYEALCRGDFSQNSTKFYCYYKMDRPYLKLAPIKVEIMSLDPLVALFRQVISDEEIETIQSLAKSKLIRATVFDSETGESEISTVRINKSAWLNDSDDEVVQRITQRIGLMTNLDIEASEELQVANYGIGGHYVPHHDFFSGDKYLQDEYGVHGNRIATVLFYLSQPDIGGATAFVKLKTFYLPSKNDALFWYNMLRSGEVDHRTLHGACPVLVGSKWISNKWIREGSQEFRRPCGLSPSALDDVVYLGAPRSR